MDQPRGVNRSRPRAREGRADTGLRDVGRGDSHAGGRPAPGRLATVVAGALALEWTAAAAARALGDRPGAASNRPWRGRGQGAGPAGARRHPRLSGAGGLRGRRADFRALSPLQRHEDPPGPMCAVRRHWQAILRRVRWRGQTRARVSDRRTLSFQRGRRRGRALESARRRYRLLPAVLDVAVWLLRWWNHRGLPLRRLRRHGARDLRHVFTAPASRRTTAAVAPARAGTARARAAAPQARSRCTATSATTRAVSGPTARGVAASARARSAREPGIAYECGGNAREPEIGYGLPIALWGRPQVADARSDGSGQRSMPVCPRSWNGTVNRYCRPPGPRRK